MTINSKHVLDTISELFLTRGIPEYIRSDNGSEFTEKMLRKFIEDVGAKTAYITPGSPWENGFIERFNGTLRDELLNREVFYSLEEARALIEISAESIILFGLIRLSDILLLFLLFPLLNL